MGWRSLLWRFWRLLGHKRRHRKCLQRIARLEAELWPEIAPKTYLEKLTSEFMLGHGQVFNPLPVRSQSAVFVPNPRGAFSPSYLISGTENEYGYPAAQLSLEGVEKRQL